MAVIVLFVVAAFLASYAHGFDFDHNITERDVQKIITEQCYSNFCWNNTEDYPADEIDQAFQLVKNSETFGNILKKPSVSVSLQGDKHCSLCNHILNLEVEPMVIKDMDTTYYVVRTEYYHPSIVLKLCQPETETYKSRCSQVEKNLTLNQITTCDQKSTTIKLLVYDQRNNSFKSKNLQYESGCVCVIKNTE